MTDRQQCKARARTGAQCKRNAVAGGTVCRFHGGAAPQVAAKAKQRIARAEAEEALRTFGIPIKTNAEDAALEELWRASGAVAWLTMIVNNLDQKRVVQRVAKIETRTGFQAGRAVTVEANVNVWVQLWQQERDRKMRAAKLCHDMGISERQTAVAEATAATMLVATLTRVFDRIGLSDEQLTAAARVVPEVLRTLQPAEAGA